MGYRNYADDVAEIFVERAAENGIDVFRVFDAVNDLRNFETVVPIIKKMGMHFQGAICYSLTEPRMGGDVYNADYYVKKAKELEDMGLGKIEELPKKNSEVTVAVCVCVVIDVNTTVCNRGGPRQGVFPKGPKP